MSTSQEDELKSDIRQQTGYTTPKHLSDEGLTTAVERAKTRVRVEAGVGADFEWFDEEYPEREDALFWWGCLFAKVQKGELDGQDQQAGALDRGTLLAKADNEETTWYRHATTATDTIRANRDAGFAMSSPTRGGNRDYSNWNPRSNNSGTGSGTGTGTGGGAPGSGGL